MWGVIPMRTRTRAILGTVVGLAVTVGLSLASTASAYAGFSMGH
jgi:hypothetical protein